MPRPIVECIPNFSEARRPEVINEIVKTIQSIKGVSILDQHSDHDHNRTVITYAGSPEAAAEAAFLSIKTAAQLINLDEHSGEHPRIGATDVFPFVPISDITMAECVEITQRLGKRVGDELNIPVYLYEEAARLPHRKNLENIRRGEYETLKKEIVINPDRAPDYGPLELSPAGATVIGARHPLIAFNVFLTTEDVEIANKIATAVRHSSGGLRYVKALGLQVGGLAQVSMNLTNYKKTPVARVVELIRREAARFGVDIHHSELVGLIPQGALVDASVWFMQMDGFEPDQILETRLYTALSGQSIADNFLDSVASSEPTPGGGSVSAHTAAAAAALVAMTGRLTTGKKKYAKVEEQMINLVEEAEILRAELTNKVIEDAAAFNAIMSAYKLPKNTPQEQETRSKAILESTLKAAMVPLEVAQKAVAVLELSIKAAVEGNVNAITDAGSAAVLADAALKGSGLNVRVNLANLNDQAQAQPIVDELQRLEEKAQKLIRKIRKILLERANLPLP